MKRPLTPPEVKIAKTVKDELREDMVARQVEMMKKLHYLYFCICICIFVFVYLYLCIYIDVF